MSSRGLGCGGGPCGATPGLLSPYGYCGMGIPGVCNKRGEQALPPESLQAPFPPDSPGNSRRLAAQLLLSQPTRLESLGNGATTSFYKNKIRQGSCSRHNSHEDPRIHRRGHCGLSLRCGPIKQLLVPWELQAKQLHRHRGWELLWPVAGLLPAVGSSQEPAAS